LSDDKAKPGAKAVGNLVVNPGRPLDAIHTHPGDVLIVDVPKGSAFGHEQAYQRPWVVISSNTRMHRANLDLVMAVPLTSNVSSYGQFREARIRIPVDEMTSIDPRWIPVASLALTEHLRSISIERALYRAGTVSARAVSSIRAAVRYLMDL
jgi:mRNA-degrading endonuclease toxin of MazEF toxin-antitoxin module